MKANGEFTTENFERYDKENPHIWEGFVKYTMEVTPHRKYFSAKAVISFSFAMYPSIENTFLTSSQERISFYHYLLILLL